jgi:chemotaxis-related protein WspD
MTRLIPAAEFAAANFEIVSCWKRIGIEGDKSCPELQRHVHCRNCPVFSLAAAAFLDRELPAETALSATGTFSSAAAKQNAEARSESATIFRIGSEWFGLPTLAADEVIGLRPIHSLPRRRNSGLLGLVNIRGELVICLSIAVLLVGAAACASAQARLIVVRPPRGRLALPVDEVLHVHHYSLSELQALPATVARSPSRFTRALLPCADKVIGLLDEQALFDALHQSLT